MKAAHKVEVFRAFIGVDPGVSTGVAIGVFLEHELRLKGLAECISAAKLTTATLVARQISSEVAIGAGIRKMIDECHVTGNTRREVASVTVAIEDFTLRAVHSYHRDGLSPVRITACIHALCLHAPGVQWETYSPADSKSIVSDARLRAWGGWIRGRDHERDAVRQLIMSVRQYRKEHGAGDAGRLSSGQ